MKILAPAFYSSKRLCSDEHVKLVMLDLDGTLVDSLPNIAQAVDRMLAEFGYPAVGESRVRQWVGQGAAVLVKSAIDFVEPEVMRHGLQFERMHPSFLQYYHDNASNSTSLYEGVLVFLDHAAAIELRLACITNKPKAITDKLLQALDLTKYFSLVLGGDSLPQKKPDPAPLRYAMQALGVTAQQSVMIGDSKSDVLAARAAECRVGCVTYGYNHGEPVENLNADFLIDSLAELI